MKKDKLVLFWSKRENDMMVRYPRREDGALVFARMCSKRVGLFDRNKMQNVFEDSFIDELKARGYDPTTIRFEIQLSK